MTLCRYVPGVVERCARAMLSIGLLVGVGCANEVKDDADRADDGSALAFEVANRYLGQSPPGTTPQVFAPGVVSLPDMYEFGSVFTADGLTLYFGVDLGDRAEIRGMAFEDGAWWGPEVVLAHPEYGYNDPFLSPDEDRLYFISNRPWDGGGPPKDIDIGFIERTGTGWGAASWSKPRSAGAAINSARDEYYISFQADGGMVFASNIAAPEDRRFDFDLYLSRREGDGFEVPERLPGEINTGDYEADAFVDPDGRYIVFSSRRSGGLGRGDLHISVRQDDGSWGPGRNLGAPINTEGHELCPFVTRDGEYLFYTSNEDIYWVDAAILGVEQRE